jgi:hypothetical protein
LSLNLDLLFLDWKLTLLQPDYECSGLDGFSAMDSRLDSGRRESLSLDIAIPVFSVCEEVLEGLSDPLRRYSPADPLDQYSPADPLGRHSPVVGEGDGSIGAGEGMYLYARTGGGSTDRETDGEYLSGKLFDVSAGGLTGSFCFAAFCNVSTLLRASFPLSDSSKRSRSLLSES